MPSKHLMIDIETLSTRMDAAILSIGACIFDPRAPGEIDETFSVVISAESNESAGRHISAGTVMWWMQQSQEAREALFIDPHNLTDALTKFRVWINEHQPECIWANSPSFDLVILEHALRSLGMMVPWHYWGTRDVRTAKDLGFPEGDVPNLEFNGENVAHNALDDAIKQAMLVQLVYARLDC